MTLAGVNYVTVNATFVNSNNVPLVGQVVFTAVNYAGTPLDLVYNDTVIVSTPIIVNLDNTGSISVSLIATDSPNITNTGSAGFLWQVNELFAGAPSPFLIQLPSFHTPTNLVMGSIPAFQPASSGFVSTFNGRYGPVTLDIYDITATGFVAASADTITSTTLTITQNGATFDIEVAADYLNANLISGSASGKWASSPPGIGASINFSTTNGVTTANVAPFAEAKAEWAGIYSISDLNSFLTNQLDSSAGAVSIQLPYGELVSTGGLVVPIYTKIQGQGPSFFGSCILINAGSAADGLTMYEYTGSGKTNAFFCTLKDFMIDVSGQHAPAGSWNNGITCITNPFASQAPSDPDFDPQHLFSNLYIKNASGEGLYEHSRGEIVHFKLWAESSGGTAFVPTFDTEWIACKGQGSGLGGYLMTHSDVSMNACHSYNNGYNLPMTYLAVSGANTVWTITYNSMSSLNANTFTATAGGITTAALSLAATGAQIAAAFVTAGLVGVTGTGQLQGGVGANTATITFAGNETLTVTNAQTITAGQVVVYNQLLYYAKNTVTNYNSLPAGDSTNFGTITRPVYSSNACPDWGWGYYFDGVASGSMSACTTSENAAGSVYIHASSGLAIHGAFSQTNCNPNGGANLATNPNNYAQFEFDDARACNIEGALSGSGASSYLVRFVNGSLGNVVNITTDTNYGAVFSPDTTASAAAGNYVFVNGALQVFPYTATTSSNALTIPAGVTNAAITLSHSYTAPVVTLPTPVGGQTLYLQLLQDGTGGASWTVTNCRLPSRGSTDYGTQMISPTTTANAEDDLVFYCFDGVNWTLLYADANVGSLPGVVGAPIFAYSPTATTSFTVTVSPKALGNQLVMAFYQYQAGTTVVDTAGNSWTELGHSTTFPSLDVWSCTVTAFPNGNIATPTVITVTTLSSNYGAELVQFTGYSNIAIGSFVEGTANQSATITPTGSGSVASFVVSAGGTNTTASSGWTYSNFSDFGGAYGATATAASVAGNASTCVWNNSGGAAHSAVTVAVY